MCNGCRLAFSGTLFENSTTMAVFYGTTASTRMLRCTMIDALCTPTEVVCDTESSATGFQ